MIEIFKTRDGSLEQIETVEKDCWISMLNPTPHDIHQIASICSVEEDVLKAALDPEESARIEIEDDYTLMIVDIPSIEKEVVAHQASKSAVMLVTVSPDLSSGRSKMTSSKRYIVWLGWPSCVSVSKGVTLSVILTMVLSGSLSNATLSGVWPASAFL